MWFIAPSARLHYYCAIIIHTHKHLLPQTHSHTHTHTGWIALFGVCEVHLHFPGLISCMYQSGDLNIILRPRRDSLTSPCPRPPRAPPPAPQVCLLWRSTALSWSGPEEPKSKPKGKKVFTTYYSICEAEYFLYTYVRLWPMGSKWLLMWMYS